MYGEPIHALNNALSGMINTLRSDAQALDSLWISIITFDREVKELMPLTELVQFRLPEITCPQSGPTNTGAALEFVLQKVKSDIIKGSDTQKGDWKPLLFLFTDGKPSDIQLYREKTAEIRGYDFGAVVGCAAGHLANDAMLKEFTNNVVHLDSADSQTLKMFFKWVSETIEQGSKSQGTGEAPKLPPPPDEITVVI
jgi:uncharacterized protein YegL